MNRPSQDEILGLLSHAWANEPTELSFKTISHWVAEHHAQANRYLDAVGTHGSPLYALDTSQLQQRAAQFCEAFQRQIPTSVRAYYAVKSNHHPLIIKTLLSCGLGLDVSSGQELELALRLGAKDIIFSGPGKTTEELALAVSQPHRVTVLMDSFSELERLQNQARRQGVVVKTGIRLTTDPRGLWRKFGIPLSHLGAFVHKASVCSHISLKGIQFHTSWNLTSQAQVSFIERLGETLRQLSHEWVRQLEFIDIGGGYWPEAGEWLQAAGTTAGAVEKLLSPHTATTEPRFYLPGTPIETFAQELGHAIEEHLCTLVDVTICLEPGRWLCHDAMHLLMTVVDCKAPDLVITDAGTNAIGWERFETDYFPIINLTSPGLHEHRCDVYGSLCTPHDVWGYSYWGERIQAGDVLLIPSQGAYTYSLRQDFIKALPITIDLAKPKHHIDNVTNIPLWQRKSK